MGSPSKTKPDSASGFAVETPSGTRRGVRSWKGFANPRYTSTRRLFLEALEGLMQRRRYRYGFHCRWTLCCLGLVAPLLTSGCAPGSVSRLSGVGCADPSCNTAMPETRKVLACIGDACDDDCQTPAIRLRTCLTNTNTDMFEIIVDDRLKSE